jgi:hypothetical protein
LTTTIRSRWSSYLHVDESILVLRPAVIIGETIILSGHFAGGTGTPLLFLVSEYAEIDKYL